MTDIKGFYCPTRRTGLRAGTDTQLMLSGAWTGGGVDYGGCAGRHGAFTTTAPCKYIDSCYDNQGTMGYAMYNFGSAGTNTPALQMGTAAVVLAPTISNVGGIFGQTNQSITFGQIRDGLSNTFLTGELQRISSMSSTGQGFSGCPGNSVDGWAIGGPCTLFTTGQMMVGNGSTSMTSTTTGGLMLNNLFFGSPGSDHPNGCNMGLADGSVTFVSSAIDANVFNLLGSMADGLPAQLPN
jgi:prepilin-type processing-associated H-X9-DG protein